jgi:hypothetical protein
MRLRQGSSSATVAKDSPAAFTKCSAADSDESVLQFEEASVADLGYKSCVVAADSELESLQVCYGNS